jgi:hypothetical protein
MLRSQASYGVTAHRRNLTVVIEGRLIKLGRGPPMLGGPLPLCKKGSTNRRGINGYNGVALKKTKERNL